MLKELKQLAGESGVNDDQLIRDMNEVVVDSNLEETNGGTSDQMDSSFVYGESDLDDITGIENGNINGTKLTCAICLAQIADNPSSLGLHVRNHLDYKP